MNGSQKGQNMYAGADGEKMYRAKKQEDMATRSYARERLETVECIGCEKNYQIKVIEHETVINKSVTKQETLCDIFCPNCNLPHIGINFIKLPK